MNSRYKDKLVGVYAPDEDLLRKMAELCNG